MRILLYRILKSLSHKNARHFSSKIGVAFDVDGVLTRTPNAIPGAREALDMLTDAKVPFCLMTNGGGATEASKASQISSILGLQRELKPSQICLAHTPMRLLADNLRGKGAVLLVGKRYQNLKEIARVYGFERTVTIEELHAQFPDLYPDLPPSIRPGDIGQPLGTDERIAAVLCMIDPLEWGREVQIMCDVLMSDGRLGTVADEQVVTLYNSCADFQYAARWPLPRFGAGAFRLALEAIWINLRGNPLRQTLYGKPHIAQYHYVEHLLNELNSEETADGRGQLSTVKRFFMVGDNPLTDIRGATQANKVSTAQWQGVLVRTGLWDGGENDVIDPADAVVDDVRAAVSWILEQK